MSSLRVRSRDNEGVPNAVGQPPDRPGRVDSFCGLVGNGTPLQYFIVKVQNKFCRDYGYDYKGLEQRRAGIARLE